MSNQSRKSSVALLDGDILTYRVGFASEDVSEKIAKARMKDTIVDILMEMTDVGDYEGYLSGPTEDNFRMALAVTAPYKGNRPGNKPVHYECLRDYLAEEWEFSVSSGQEADDDIAIKATELGAGSFIIVSIDKDFLQIPGKHYNWVKREYYDVSEIEGLRNFYKQILCGDRVDNVIGIRGIGPVKADRILGACTTEAEMYAAVLAAYEGNRDRVIENGRLLFLRRVPDQIWEPPQ